MAQKASQVMQSKFRFSPEAVCGDLYQYAACNRESLESQKVSANTQRNFGILFLNAVSLEHAHRLKTALFAAFNAAVRDTWDIINSCLVMSWSSLDACHVDVLNTCSSPTTLLQHACLAWSSIW